MKWFFLALLIALPNVLWAQQASSDPSPWRGGFGLGYGERSNPLIQSDDIPVVLDIDIVWFGERFFFDNGDLGFTFTNNPSNTTSVVARFNSDRVFFSKANTRFISIGNSAQAPGLIESIEVEPPDRDYAVELGFETLIDGTWGALSVAGYQDVSNTHDGYEIMFDYARGTRLGRWYIEPSIGASFRSASRNDYYWGVRAAEVSFALPAYEAEAGLKLQAQLRGSYHVSKQLERYH